MYRLNALLNVDPADEKKVLKVFISRGYRFAVERNPHYNLNLQANLASEKLAITHGKTILAIAKNTAKSGFVDVSKDGEVLWAENIVNKRLKNPPTKPTISIDVISELRSKMVLKPEDVVEMVRLVEEKESFLQNKKEHMWAIGVDTRNHVVFMDLISLGTLNYNIVHPRETFRRAVIEGVAALILVHNHPSETPEFSDEDLKLMKRFTQAGVLLGIEILDFMIYAGGQFKSARKEHLI